MASAALSALRSLTSARPSTSSPLDSIRPVDQPSTFSPELASAYKRLIVSYEAKIAELEAREASAAWVATAALSIVKDLDPDDTRLDTIWVNKSDRDDLAHSSERGYLSAGRNDDWVWKAVSIAFDVSPSLTPSSRSEISLTVSWKLLVY